MRQVLPWDVRSYLIDAPRTTPCESPGSLKHALDFGVQKHGQSQHCFFLNLRPLYSVQVL
jgi:hypothetical protein